MWTDDTFFRTVLAATTIAGVGMRIGFQTRAARLGGPVIRRSDRGVFWVGVAILMPFLLGPLVAFLIDPAALPWSRLPLPRAVRWMGAGLTIASIGLIAWVFVSLGENLTRTAGFRAKSRLVTSGPYRRIRHPLYTFAGIGWLGIGLMIASWPVLLGVLAMPFLLNLRIEREERALLERFGDQYASYMQRTGRFFPRRA